MFLRCCLHRPGPPLQNYTLISEILSCAPATKVQNNPVFIPLGLAAVCHTNLNVSTHASQLQHVIAQSAGLQHLKGMDFCDLPWSEREKFGVWRGLQAFSSKRWGFLWISGCFGPNLEEFSAMLLFECEQTNIFCHFCSEPDNC